MDIRLLNLTCEKIGNLTKLEVVKEISTEPYFLSGMMILFAIGAFIWFIFGFRKVSGKSKKVAFQSWIHWIFALALLAMAMFYLFWFITPFSIGG